PLDERTAAEQLMLFMHQCRARRPALCCRGPAAAVAGDAGGWSQRRCRPWSSKKRFRSWADPATLKTVATRARRWEEQRCLSALDKRLQKGSLPCGGRDSGLQSVFDSVGVECLRNELECGREIFFESGPDLARRKDESTFGLTAG